MDIHGNIGRLSPDLSQTHSIEWVFCLISIPNPNAKKNGAYAETLLDIAEYLSDCHYSDFDEMAVALNK